MTIVYPYSLAFLADILKIASVIFDVQRNDQMSGTGDGRILSAELAPPLWTAEIVLAYMTHQEAKQVNARLRRLHGSIQAMLLYDPEAKYPAYDPNGTIVGSNVVVVNSVGSDRASLRLGGLPAGYKLTPGDKLEVLNDNGGRRSFLEVSEAATAASTGITGTFGVFPNVPAWLAANLTVNLKKPAMRCIIMPGTYKPGTVTIEGVSGAGFKVIERK